MKLTVFHVPPGHFWGAYITPLLVERCNNNYRQAFFMQFLIDVFYGFCVDGDDIVFKEFALTQGCVVENTGMNVNTIKQVKKQLKKLGWFTTRPTFYLEGGTQTVFKLNVNMVELYIMARNQKIKTRQFELDARTGYTNMGIAFPFEKHLYQDEFGMVKEHLYTATQLQSVAKA